MSANPDRSLSFPILAGLAGRCPRCGKGKLFRGFLQLRRRCLDARLSEAVRRVREALA